MGCEGVEVVEVVRSWTDAKHSVDERPGVLHVAVVSQHIFFEVGPCFSVLVFVEDGPVVRCPICVAEHG